MLQKKWLLGLVGAGLLVVGMAGGVVLASNLNAFAGSYAPRAATATTPNAYCQLYLNTVASKLGKNASDLASANQAGMQAVIDQMAKDGKITADQKSKLEQRLKDAGQNPCALLGGLGHLRGAKAGALGGALAGARSAIETKVAGALGIQVSELESDLKSGQSIQQIATSKKADYATVKSAYLSAVQDQLNTAVKNGTITQTQSTAIYTKIQQAVNNNIFPLLQRGGHGMMGAPGMKGMPPMPATTN